MRTWGSKKWDEKICSGYRGWGPPVVGTSGKLGRKISIHILNRMQSTLIHLCRSKRNSMSGERSSST